MKVLAARRSDHRPILFSMSQSGSRDWRVRKTVRFKASWALKEECEGGMTKSNREKKSYAQITKFDGGV